MKKKMKEQSALIRWFIIKQCLVLKEKLNRLVEHPNIERAFLIVVLLVLIIIIIAPGAGGGGGGTGG